MPPLACVLAPPAAAACSSSARRCSRSRNPPIGQSAQPIGGQAAGDNQAVEPRISGVVTLAWVRVKTSVPSDCVCGPFA